MPRSSLPLRYQHWRYVWIPVFGSFMWFSTLLSMLITWLATGRPRYPSQDAGNIAYISDVGASYLKPLFVVGCCITAVCFVLSLIILNWLKHHSHRLIADKRICGRVCGIFAVLGAFIGGAGLILLSVFDTEQYTILHRVFLLVFMVGVVMSAIFTVVQFRWLSKENSEIRSLRYAYLFKAILATVLIALSIAFAICLFGPSTGVQNAAAILEWVIAFGFTLYLLSFYVDLRHSKNVERGGLADAKPRESEDKLRVSDG